MDKRKIISISISIVLVAVIVYFFFFTNSLNKLNQNSNENSFNLVYDKCTSCSNSALNVIYSLFKSQNSPLNAKNISFNSSEGISLISNYSVTALPSLMINETNKSEMILDSLVYLNMFNVEGDYFVLNTPFLAGLTKGMTYFDLIQNRTITSFDIFNQSSIYNNTNQSFINPSEVLELFNSTNYTNKNKIIIDFIYSNSSFSAVQSLILYKALSNFGNFSNLNTLISPEVSFSQGETLGNTEFYVLNGKDYSSNYFNLESSNIINLSTSTYVDTLEKQLFEFDQNSAYPFFSNLGNFMPFIDIGGKYIEISSMLNPKIFSGLTINQIDNLIITNKTAGEAFNDSVYFVQTLLCSYIGYNNTRCNSPIID